jgi:sporulation protein YlmC with PRC-barrel domain
MSGLRLVHDVLDAQLVDRRTRKIGRVDSVVLALDDGRAPRVSAILVGGPVRAERIGRWMVRLERVMRALGRVRQIGVTSIPFAAVRCIGNTIHVDLDGDTLEVVHLEVWLAQHVVCRIPGAGCDDEKERK